MEVKKLTTNEKAFAINQDANIYGSFAEIGAGQEVARNFFRVGGASATIAKTISAYDMVVSDAIYGAEENKRYVCESRLNKMLTREFKQLQERLTPVRTKTKFFAFADTVAAKSSKVSRNWHGWMGVRFQTKAQGAPNDIIIHVRMLDQRNHLQQEALGVVGVNLIFGAFYLRDNPTAFVASLTEGLESHRIEIDLIKFVGPDLNSIDDRHLGLCLVDLGLTSAVLFTPDGEVAQPTETFYNKDVIVQRGNFRPANNLNLDMLRCGAEQFANENSVDSKQMIVVPELNASKFSENGKIDFKDFTARIDLLRSQGFPVLVSKYKYYHELRMFLTRCATKKIGIIMGVGHLSEIFDEKSFPDVEGGMLESLGKLFNGDVKLYVYPAYSLSTENPEVKDKKGTMYSADNFAPAGHLQKLYLYFKDINKVQGLKNFKPEVLEINSRTLFRKIAGREEGWEALVPKSVAKLIRDHDLFRGAK